MYTYYCSFRMTVSFRHILSRCGLVIGVFLAVAFMLSILEEYRSEFGGNYILRVVDRANVTTNYMFPMRNPDLLRWQVGQIESSLTRKPLDELIKLRNDHLHILRSNYSFQLSGEPKKYLEREEENWSDAISKLSNTLGVIRFEATLTDLKKTMYSNIHNYSFTECNYLINTFEKGYKANPNVYHTKCFKEEESSWTSQELRPEHMNFIYPGEMKASEGHIPLTFLHIHMDAIVSSTGYIYFKNYMLAGRQCLDQGGSQSKYKIPSTVLKVENIYDEVFSISQIWSEGFFHFMEESLGRISPYIQFLLNNPTIKIHVKSTSTSFIVNNLANFGISKDRLISGRIGARLLYFPQSGPCGKTMIFTGRLESMYHRLAIKREPEPRRTIVMIRRSTRRYFNHHDEIFASLKAVALEYGNYSVEVFDDRHFPSLSDTTAMFNRAFMVVAPHGAGESNLQFSEPGTILIEGLCKPVVMCYRDLCAGLGHRYYGIRYENLNCFEYRSEHIIPHVRKYLDIIAQKTLGNNTLR